MHVEESRKNRRILIIDDNAAIHDDFRKILCGGARNEELQAATTALFGSDGSEESMGVDYEIDCAFQGQEGVAKVVEALNAGRPYALAFVDMRMPPGWDGIETIQHLWEHDPAVQVVICTAYSDHGWSEIASQLGKRSDQLLILKKPFDNVEICQLAAALTKKYHLAEQAQLTLEQLERRVENRTRCLREVNEQLLSEIAERQRVEVELAEKETQLRQAQKLESIGALAGGIAHEFNNLLQTIGGYIHYAMEDLSPRDRSHQDLQDALTATKRAATLVGQLLGFSRRRVLDVQLLNPNETVLELERMLRPLIASGIELVLELGEDVGTINADAGELLRILLNLCINARDAMPNGGTLTVKTANEELTTRQCDPGQAAVPGPHVIITVSDTGDGMSPELLQHIFEPFFTTKEVGKGTGLGLAMVYGIVQQHHGAIHVESAPGQGTTFAVRFPHCTTMPKPQATPPVTTPSHAQQTILIAEDEPSIRRLAVRALRQAGFTVHEAADGDEAVRIIEQYGESISLALLDQVMPRMGGREVLQRIRDRHPRTRIIFCTAYDRDSDQATSLSEEGCRVLSKPFTSNMLLQTVREVLQTTDQAAFSQVVN